MPNAPDHPMGRRILSRTAEHALRALHFLARRPSTGLVSAGEVAAALGTPPNYTAKTLRAAHEEPRHPRRRRRGR